MSRLPGPKQAGLVRHEPQAGSARRRQDAVTDNLRAVTRWYLREVYGRHEGPGTQPFYCEPLRVGAFAVSPSALAAGRGPALFRLFVTLSMYQALRDVVIMRRQRALPARAARPLLEVAFLARTVAAHRCPALRSHAELLSGCDVAKQGELVDCARWPGLPCPIKEATVAFDRMGDAGKLPTSAWLLYWKDGLGKLLAEVKREEASPPRRAELLVQHFAQVHRVGRKLATLFVSALSTPALAPGLTPWFPEIDGNELVVVDTNVARAVDALRAPGAPKSYEARARWLCQQAAQLDLRELAPKLPARSPRLVQQALYCFCSKSNRAARRDSCAQRPGDCASCAPALCPFRSS